MTPPTIPQHIAIIMDGNGRWAQARGEKRLMGHRAGAKTLENVLAWCVEMGVRYLTVYAFSTENWKRPTEEVGGLMRLFGMFLKSKEKKLLREHIRFRMIGRRSDLDAKLIKAVENLEQKTNQPDCVCTLTAAISYGGRDEIVRAAKRFAAFKAQNAQLTDEEAFAQCLDTADTPEPDLIIRTSGELRVSNFLLWQCAYSEFYVTPVLWPDFSRANFEAAITSYATRDRRKGGHK